MRTTDWSESPLNGTIESIFKAKGSISKFVAIIFWYFGCDVVMWRESSRWQGSVVHALVLARARLHAMREP